MIAPVLIHLLRHGAPVLAGRLLGRTDCPATPAGIAACVAAVAGIDRHAILASDLRRASACAAAIAQGATARIDPRWRELDFGDWDGHAPATIDPAALARFHADPDAAPPPGGESWSALVARVGAALDDVADGSLVVTHAGAMRAALAAACGFDQRQVWAVDLPYAALLSLRLWRGDVPMAQIVGLRT
jgi:alpha-ribazole phosphatase